MKKNRSTEERHNLSGGKYYWLWNNELATTEWKHLKPQEPFFLFIPQNTDLLAEYQAGHSVQTIFSEYTTAVQTARDSFATTFSKAELRKHLDDFIDESVSDEDVVEKYGVSDARDWSYKDARKQLREVGINESLLMHYLYRPFDIRFIYYSPLVVAWPRTQISTHTVGRNNIVLLITRNSDCPANGIALATRGPADKRSIADSKGEAKYFYLYLYDSEKATLFDSHKSTGTKIDRCPNFTAEFITYVVARLKLAFISDEKGDRVKTFGPEDIFDYMYALFHSPTYRSRYAEFLKMDFPRLLLTSNLALFRQLCGLGTKLVGLHLIEKLGPKITSYPVAGDNTVETVRYTEPGQGAAKGRVWINKSQYFEGVSPDVWDFHIGGYQVSQKWLKDRKGRQLTYDDLTNYQNTVSTLAETIRLMAEIDETIDAHGGWPIK